MLALELLPQRQVVRLEHGPPDAALDGLLQVDEQPADVRRTASSGRGRPRWCGRPRPPAGTAPGTTRRALIPMRLIGPCSASLSRRSSPTAPRDGRVRRCLVHAALAVGPGVDAGEMARGRPGAHRAVRGVDDRDPRVVQRRIALGRPHLGELVGERSVRSAPASESRIANRSCRVSQCVIRAEVMFCSVAPGIATSDTSWSRVSGVRYSTGSSASAVHEVAGSSATPPPVT